MGAIRAVTFASAPVQVRTYLQQFYPHSGPNDSSFPSVWASGPTRQNYRTLYLSHSPAKRAPSTSEFSQLRMEPVSLLHAHLLNFSNWLVSLTASHQLGALLLFSMSS